MTDANTENLADTTVTASPLDTLAKNIPAESSTNTENDQNAYENVIENSQAKAEDDQESSENTVVETKQAEIENNEIPNENAITETPVESENIQTNGETSNNVDAEITSIENVTRSVAKNGKRKSSAISGLRTPRPSIVSIELSNVLS